MWTYLCWNLGQASSLFTFCLLLRAHCCDVVGIWDSSVMVFVFHTLSIRMSFYSDVEQNNFFLLSKKRQQSLFGCKISPDGKTESKLERRWHGLNIPTTGLYKSFNSMCSAAVQIIWSRFDCNPPPPHPHPQPPTAPSSFWVACSALALEHVQFHWSLAQITNGRTQRSGGLGLEQKAEPAVGWWRDHRLLVLWWGSFLSLLMLLGVWAGGWSNSGDIAH